MLIKWPLTLALFCLALLGLYACDESSAQSTYQPSVMV